MTVYGKQRVARFVAGILCCVDIPLLGGFLDSMSLRFDAVLKEILGKDPADFQPAIHLPSTRPASRLNVDLSTISAATEGGLALLPLATLCRMPADKPLVEAVRDVVRQNRPSIGEGN